MHHRLHLLSGTDLFCILSGVALAQESVTATYNATTIHIDDDDAFAVRTTLRLNVGLGSAPLYADPALK